MDVIKVDGCMGEGGGQVLRTSLTLSMLLQRDIEIRNIRAGRNKPGLLRQHLTCVRAAKVICNAEVEGDEIGSQRILFKPGPVESGTYRFSVGSAGSTVLVCQTILLALMFARDASEITFEGGTHNDMAPSVTFLQQSFLSVLESIGAMTKVSIDRFGFYPAGGGRWTLHISPVARLSNLDFHTISGLSGKALHEQISVSAIVSSLPVSIAEREISALTEKLGLNKIPAEVMNVPSAGPGNMLTVCFKHEHYCSVFELPGKLGVSAENVAKRVAGRLRKWLSAEAQVEEYLADQLLLPLLMAGKGKFTTTKPSSHTKTNIELIKQITGVEIECSEINELKWQICLDIQPLIKRCN